MYHYFVVVLFFFANRNETLNRNDAVFVASIKSFTNEEQKDDIQLIEFFYSLFSIFNREDRKQQWILLQ